MPAHGTFPPGCTHQGSLRAARISWGPCLPLMLSSSSSSSSVLLAPAAKNINQHLEASRASPSGQKRGTHLLCPPSRGSAASQARQNNLAERRNSKRGGKCCFSPQLGGQQTTNSPAGARGTRRAGSVLAGAVSWMPESKHDEEKHHLTLLLQFPVAPVKEQS